MRVLLDENIDRRLRRFFDAQFEVVTVVEQGWGGRSNGELLRVASLEFDVLVTMDQNLPYQQNLGQYSIGILVIQARSNRRQELEPIMPVVNQILPRLGSGEVRIVEA